MRDLGRTSLYHSLSVNRNQEVDFCVIVRSQSPLRLSCLMYRPPITSRFRVEVKHRYSPPNRYSWEIYSEDKILAVKESTEKFNSWETASQNGNDVLRELSES